MFNFKHFSAIALLTMLILSSFNLPLVPSAEATEAQVYSFSGVGTYQTEIFTIEPGSNPINITFSYQADPNLSWEFGIFFMFELTDKARTLYPEEGAWGQWWGLGFQGGGPNPFGAPVDPSSDTMTVLLVEGQRGGVDWELATGRFYFSVQTKGSVSWSITVESTKSSTPPPPPEPPAANLSGEWSGTYLGVLVIGGKTYFEYGKLSMYLTQTESSFTGIMTLSRSNGTYVTAAGVSVSKKANIKGTVTENNLEFSFTSFTVNIGGTVTEYGAGSTAGVPPISGSFTSDSMHLSYKGPQLDAYWYKIFDAYLSRGSSPDGAFSFRIVPESYVWILPPRLEQGPLYPYQTGYQNKFFSIYIEATNATPELVSLQALGPEGLDIRFDPQTGYPPFRSTVLVDASHVEQNITAPYGLSVPPGTYSLMIIGESGGLVRSREVALTLQYFSVNPLPSQWPPPYPSWWVKKTQGDVKIERGGQSMPAKEGQQSGLGDTIKAGKDGIIIIMGPDGSEIKFKEPVAEFVYPEEHKTESGVALEFTPSPLLKEPGLEPTWPFILGGRIGALTVAGLILSRYGYGPYGLIKRYPVAVAKAGGLAFLAAGSLYAFHKYLESQSQRELQAYVEEFGKQPEQEQEPPKPIPQQLLDYTSQISSRTVITPDCVITSGGTELTVDVDAEGTRVRVLSGTVEVLSYDGQNTTLTTKQQLRLRYVENGTSIFEPSTFDPSTIDKWWLLASEQTSTPTWIVLVIAIITSAVFLVIGINEVVTYRQRRKRKAARQHRKIQQS